MCWPDDRNCVSTYLHPQILGWLYVLDRRPADFFAIFLLDHWCLSFSLISGAFISGERFYATYWPFKHRMLSIPTYRVLICMVLDNSFSYLHSFQHVILLLSFKHSMHLWMHYTLILTFIIWGSNIGIWRTFQHGEVPSQQQKRASQNISLTETNLTLLSLRPLIILNHFISILFGYRGNFITWQT